MPRLSDVEYLIRHDLVHNVWTNNPAYFGYLTDRQQRDIHVYFQTTSDAKDDELISRRKLLTRNNPSLPHRAGRAFLAFLRPPVEETRPQSTKSKNTSTRIVANPEIDFPRLVETLMDQVASLPKEERDKLAEEGRNRQDRREIEEAS